MIEQVDTWNSRLGQLGISAFDYKRDGVQTDLQDLLTDVTVGRASAVEAEIKPLSDIMRNRNKKLDQYGELLAKLNKIQTSFKEEDAKDPEKRSTIALTADEIRLLSEISHASITAECPTKPEAEQYVQLVKSAIDGLNNRSQTDMTRLQSLVDKRDQSYTKAAEFLKDIVDSRSKTISAIGS